MKTINIETWERKSHYLWFNKFSNPCFSLNVRMDATKLLCFCKDNGMPSFATILYIATKCTDNIAAFRYRILNDAVVQIPYANVCYTIMIDNKYFVNQRAATNLPYREFCQLIKAQQQQANTAKTVQAQYNDTTIVDDVYCSCVPWVDFLSATQPIPENMPESNSIPRICWGKYIYEGEKAAFTMNITANHALVDGKEMSEVFCQIQNAFDNPKNFLNWT